MLKSRRFWLSTAVSALFLALFLWKVDLAETARAIRGANYLFAAPAIAAYFGAVYFRTLRWQVLLLPMKQVPVGRLYPIVVIGYMANNLLPVRLGEFVRSYLTNRKEGMPQAPVLATIVVERVFDGVFLLLLAVLVWPFLPVSKLLTSLSDAVGMSERLLVVVLSAPFLLALSGFFVLAFFPAFGERVLRIVLSPLPSKVREPVGHLLVGFMKGFQALRSPRQALATALLTAPIWLLEAAMYVLVALGFRIALPFHAFLLTTSISNLATSLPSSAGGVGPFELGTKLTLQGMAVLPEIAAAYAIVLHLLLLVPVTLLGLVLLWQSNLSLREAAGQAPKPKPSTAQEPQD